MLYGNLTYRELQLLLEEALRHNQGDVVEIDRDLAEQIVWSMETLVDLKDAAAKTGSRPRQHDGQLDLF